MSFAGIDIGATYVKGALFGLDERRLELVVRKPFPGFVHDLPPGYREVRWADIEAVVAAVLGELLEAAGSIETLLVSNQMHGFVLCDKRGAPRSNFVSWQDTRTLGGKGESSFFHSLVKRIPEAVKVDIGHELKPGHPSAVLAWLQYRHQLPSGAVACSLGDAIVAQWSHAYPVTDPSNAAGLGLLDVRRNNWHRQMLQLLDLEKLQLPEVRSANQEGVRCARGRIGRIQPPVGDQQAALLGAELVADEISVNVATGSQVAMLAENFPCGEFVVRPYFDQRWLKTITHLPAGRALRVLTRLLAECADDSSGNGEARVLEYAMKEAETSEACGLQFDLSFFPCATGVTGSLNNIQEHNLSVGTVFRAAIECMVNNYQQCVGRIDPERQAKRVVLSGGVAQKSRLLQQQIAQRTGLPIRLAFHPEDALIGLLALGRSCADHAPVVAPRGRGGCQV